MAAVSADSGGTEEGFRVSEIGRGQQGFGRHANSVDLLEGFCQTDLTSSGTEKSGEPSAARDSDALARALREPYLHIRPLLQMDALHEADLAGAQG